MGSNKIKVGMGEGVVASEPRLFSPRGSVRVWWWPFMIAERRIGGLAHIMLPDSASVQGPRGSFHVCGHGHRRAAGGVAKPGGTHPDDLVAKMAGGARMFSSYEDGVAGIGGQNIRSVKHILRKEQIPLVGWDVAGDHGRSVEFHLASGQLIVRAIGKADKQF